MATKRLESISNSLKNLKKLNSALKDPLLQCLAPLFSRSFGSEAYPAVPDRIESSPNNIEHSLQNPMVLATIYRFPSMEPLRFETYSSRHLHLPLRRDILHRAIIYEGDKMRQGTASTKTRYEVHGSHRKIRPQKGTGHARLGHRQSPAIVGGGVVFGPHPRDFSTRLPRKVYDLAWRTALSWRYKRGDLIICENDSIEIEFPDRHYIKHIFEHNHWGKSSGRSLLILDSKRKNLTHAMNGAKEDGWIKMITDVDVKDLLQLGRVILEKKVLDRILIEHQSDLVPKVHHVV